MLSDAIWRDPGTGKRTILGTFSVIHAQHFPAIHGLVAVHVALTDGYGKYPLELRLVDAKEEGDPLLRAKADVDFEDPRMVLELDFHFQGIEFNNPGEYRFQVFTGADLLMERRLLVLSVDQPGSSEP